MQVKMDKASVTTEMLMSNGYAYPLGVILNAVQIVLIIRKKKTKLPFEKTLLSLASADLLVSMCGTLLLIFHYCLSYDEGDTSLHLLATIFGVGMIFSIFSSIFHALFIAAQRFFAVFLPIKFKLFFRCRICIICLVVIWIISFSLSLYVGNLTQIRLLSYAIYAVGCLLGICYILICYQVHCQRRSRIAMSSSSHQQNNPTCKILVYSILVTSAFIICTLPVAIALQRIFQGRILSPFILQFCGVLLALNPVFDSLLYFIFNHVKQIESGYCCILGLINSCKAREDVSSSMSAKTNACSSQIQESSI